MYKTIRTHAQFARDARLAPAPTLAQLNAAELVAGYRTKAFSPADVAKATWQSIHANNDAVNGYCFLAEETSLQQAQESEARWLAGKPAGLVDGVPTSIKDLVLMKGTPTHRGSRVVAQANKDKAPSDWLDEAPSTARLRESGAVLLGKTTTPEFGWRGSTDNTLTGITRNPLNLAKTPGGSSGGASAALAAYQGALAIGTDGGGSIRIPCAFTGTVGIKAHFGRVPAFPASPMGTVAHVGPMTRSVLDCAMMLQVISQSDSRDWLALPKHNLDFVSAAERGAMAAKGAKPLKGLRIAYSPRLGYLPWVDPAVEACVAASLSDFEAAGAVVDAVDPGIKDSAEVFRILWMSAARNVVVNLPTEQFALLDPGLQAAANDAAKYSAKDLLDANAERAQLAIAMRAFNERYDLLLTPSVAIPAFDVGIVAPPAPKAAQGSEPFDWTWWTPFSYPFNLTQAPAISIPCGAIEGGEHHGLPISLQLVAPNHREDLCFLAAAAFESLA